MMKIKNAKVPFDSEIIKKILTMLPCDMCELVATVNACACCHEQLNEWPDGKMVLGFDMLNNAIDIIEQCGGDIKLKIDCKSWTKNVKYETNVNQ